LKLAGAPRSAVLEMRPTDSLAVWASHCRADVSAALYTYLSGRYLCVVALQCGSLSWPSAVMVLLLYYSCWYAVPFEMTASQKHVPIPTDDRAALQVLVSFAVDTKDAGLMLLVVLLKVCVCS